MISWAFIFAVVAAIAIVFLRFSKKKLPMDLNDTARIRRKNSERKQRKLMRR